MKPCVVFTYLLKAIIYIENAFKNIQTYSKHNRIKVFVNHEIKKKSKKFYQFHKISHQVHEVLAQTSYAIADTSTKVKIKNT